MVKSLGKIAATDGHPKEALNFFLQIQRAFPLVQNNIVTVAAQEFRFQTILITTI
jgi:hypothetical protein